MIRVISILFFLFAECWTVPACSAVHNGVDWGHVCIYVIAVAVLALRLKNVYEPQCPIHCVPKKENIKPVVVSAIKS